MNDTQSVEGQPWFYKLDVLRSRRNEPREAAGGDDLSFTHFATDALHHAVHLGRKAIEDPGLN